MKLSKKRYIQCLGIIVIVLAILRQTNTTSNMKLSTTNNPNNDSLQIIDKSSTIVNEFQKTSKYKVEDNTNLTSRFYDSNGNLIKNRIYSVPNFGDAFPDQNDIQLIAAQQYGVNAVENRADAEHRKSELVYVGSSLFYHVDKLKSSIPYLVPRAAELLQDIGHSFFDSLQIKQIPLHKIIVTSVLRSKADVAQLRNHNGNATQNSCHLYGTTFDICYNRYKTVEDPKGPKLRQVRNDSLKWVLSEVLNDMRKNKRCYIKYEVKQGCFHITVN